MTPERWQHVEEIFHAALGRAEEERADFLDEACGADQPLRREVESLLENKADAGSFLQTPAVSEAVRLIADARSKSLIGLTLGSFEVISLLGAGGMGEVYLAKDKRLGRRVALKLLSSAVASKSEQLRRFTQEARAASSLSHPNIAHIYEISEAGGQHFIAMEFVDGVTLRQHLTRTPMQIVEAVDVAIQIASALVAAHGEGIIHRDIKPENVMLRRRDGSVKVLDFGLAKLTGQQWLDTEATTLQNTSPGVVMGTTDYMSPEQARGVEVDERTDIWSLGCVLYEVVAQRVPFEGETISDVIAAILTKEPLSLVGLVSSAPPGLHPILEKALQKERAQRYDRVEEMLRDLKILRQQIEDAAEDPQRPSVAATVKFDHGRETSDTDRRRLVALLLCLMIGALLLPLVVSWVSDKSPPSPNLSWLTTSGKAAWAVISPDGKYVAYVDVNGEKQSLRLRLVATTESNMIVPPQEVRYAGLTFSRDGSHLYFVRYEPDYPGVLYQVSVLGGAPRKILERIDSPVTFSPNGERFAFSHTNPNMGESFLMIASSADGSGAQTLASRRSPDNFGSPAWSPDGEVIACPVRDYISSRGQYESVVAISVSDGAQRPISQLRWDLIGHVGWLANGSGMIIVARDENSPRRQIWQLSYPGGEVRQITHDLNDYRGVSLTADSSALVSVRTEFSLGIWTVDLAKAADSAKQLSADRYDGRGLVWTPDGKIVYSSMAAEDNLDLWIIDADGSGPRRLTTHPRADSQPVVTPDGRYVVFESRRANGQSIWRMDLDGSNQIPLTRGIRDNEPSCSPDGKWVIYTSWGGDKPMLWQVSIDGGDPVQLTDYYSASPVVSPDGQMIACEYRDKKRTNTNRKIALVPIAGGEPIRVLDVYSSAVRWSADSRSLLYIKTREGVSNIRRRSIDEKRDEQVTRFTSDLIYYFDLSLDGKRLVVTRGTQVRDAVLIREFR